MGFLKAYYQVDDHPHHREPMGVWTPAHIKLAGDFNFSNVNFRTFLYSQNLNVPAILNEQVEVSGIKLGVNIFVSFFQLKATKRLPICNKAYHLNKEWGHTTKNPNKRYKRQFLTGEEGYRDIGTSNSINQSINQSIICFQGYIWRGDICRLLSINLKIQKTKHLIDISLHLSPAIIPEIVSKPASL